MFKSFSLKPKSKSVNQLMQDNMKEDVVTVVREDGKEFNIQREQLANHLERGFNVKDKKDLPKEEPAKTTGFADTTSAAKAKAEKKSAKKTK